MPDLSALLAALKSPKTTLAAFLFSAALLFVPFESLGLTRPAFTSEYEGFFVIVLFLSAAMLTVNFLTGLWYVAKLPYNAYKRRLRTIETFCSLNLQELCVLWAMTQIGTKTIKGSSSNHIMLSLRQKGCLRLISGLQYANQLHHEMPDEIYSIVQERGLDRMPEEFKNSPRFEDEVRNAYEEACDRWS